MKILTFFRSIFSYFLIVIISLIFIPPALIILCLPAKYRYDNRFFFFLLNLFYNLIVMSVLLPYSIEGEENLPKGPAIFVANHQSSLDIPIVGALCRGFPHVWLVLEYYFKKPILGFFISRMNIPVDRDNQVKAARSLIKALKFVRDKKRHLIIFPEGTRSTDEKIHEFFEGFAIVAKKTERPVIPIYMPNNGKIYPPRSFLINYFPIKVIIGKPMNIGIDETPKEFCSRVKQWFLSKTDNQRSM